MFLSAVAQYLLIKSHVRSSGTKTEHEKVEIYFLCGWFRDRAPEGHFTTFTATLKVFSKASKALLTI